MRATGRGTSVGAGTIALTLLALVAFASNSLLTRLALGTHQLDAATFTAIRLAAGAVTLAILTGAGARSLEPLRGAGIAGPLALFAYAAPFSFAYGRIGAAVGALVLFGVVQLTMIGYALARGEHPTPAIWLGLVLAAGGLAALAAPSVTRPDPLGVLLMAVAGVAWAVYTLVGRTRSDPLAANARSFLWSAPLAIVIAIAVHLESGSHEATTVRGLVLALLSGAVTSGIGYAIWYRALPRITVTQAAVAQLGVPVIAALGAVALLGETLGLRLVVSGAAVLAGVGLVLSARARRTG
ncbi:MAG TPA: DMT family transporter [Gemmatimonadaceae bacterium]|nr:DMT family transporter [Gemmatimonadaceae bacterium]